VLDFDLNVALACVFHWGSIHQPIMILSTTSAVSAFTSGRRLNVIRCSHSQIAR
jgi:hypothetical protein